MIFEVFLVDDQGRWVEELPPERNIDNLNDFVGRWLPIKHNAKPLLVYHGSNADWDDLTDEFELESKSGENKIACVARHILMNGGRLVVFSGAVAECKDYLSNCLKDLEFSENIDYVIVDYSIPSDLLLSNILSEGKVDEIGLSFIFGGTYREDLKSIFFTLFAMGLIMQYRFSTSFQETRTRDSSTQKIFRENDNEADHSLTSIIAKCLTSGINPFSDFADAILSKSVCDRISSEHKLRLKNRLFRINSEIQADAILAACMHNNDSISSIDGGALRLCWKLTIGRGSDYRLSNKLQDSLETEKKREFMCSLIIKANLELCECCKLVFEEIIPEGWDTNEP